MTNTTADKIKVMQAYQNGEVIEYREYKCHESTSWNILDSLEWGEPVWDWSKYDYRVKPKTKIVELWWAVLLKNNGIVITTNPKPFMKHKLSVQAYKNTSKVLKEYSDVFELPIDIIEEILS